MAKDDVSERLPGGLNGEIKMKKSFTFVLSHRRISRVGQRTGLPRAESREIVLIPTKVLCGSLDFVRAEPIGGQSPQSVWRRDIASSLIGSLLVDDRPDDFVVLHDGKWTL